MKQDSDRERLRRRAEEAEAVVEAIQNEEIDAVVGPRGVSVLRPYSVEERRLNERATLETVLQQSTAELRRRAQQLQSLALQVTEAEERERRRLAAVLHDGLQQQLVGLRFQLELLVSKLPGGPERQLAAELVELARSAIQSARSMSMELSPPMLYHQGLAEALEWLAGHYHDQRTLEVRIEAEPEASPEDERLRVFLFQAVREALLNVAKHAGVDRATVALRRLDGERELMVEDSGCGFDPAALADDEASASGLGLVSIRERAELLGATVEIDSAPGEGARLSLRWVEPAAAAPNLRDQPVRIAPSARPRAGDGTLRVLLVDDHATVRQGLRSLLERQPDVEVVGEAGDGAEGVEAARRLRPDVVVMDTSMPRMDGVEATGRIVRYDPGVRVIGLSMHEGDGPCRRMLDAGAVCYLSKTGPSAELLAAIRGSCPPAPSDP